MLNYYTHISYSCIHIVFLGFSVLTFYYKCNDTVTLLKDAKSVKIANTEKRALLSTNRRYGFHL